MSKMLTWISIISGLLLMSYMFGVLPEESSTGFVLSAILHPENLSTFKPIVILLGLGTAMGAVGLAAVVISNLTTSKFAVPEQYLIYGMVAPLMSFGYDFYLIYQSLSTIGAAGQVIGFMVLSPLLIMYAISVIEWWRGVNP